MTPGDLLKQVAEILEERGKTHGDYFENMTTIAHLWNADPNAADFSASDVAISLAQVKLARRMNGAAHNLDNYIDAIGYIAIGCVIAINTIGEETDEEQIKEAALRRFP